MIVAVTVTVLELCACCKAYVRPIQGSSRRAFARLTLGPSAVAVAVASRSACQSCEYSSRATRLVPQSRVGCTAC